MLSGGGRTVKLAGYRKRVIAPGVTEYTRKRTHAAGHYDTAMPWICWWFLSKDREVRFTGRSRIELRCAVCGTRKRIKIRIPRFGAVNPERREHPARIAFKLAHLHRDSKRHPMAWAEPLLNPAAHVGDLDLDLDLLAMRLEADLRDARERTRKAA
jgi:hypothetical protein